MRILRIEVDVVFSLERETQRGKITLVEHRLTEENKLGGVTLGKITKVLEVSREALHIPGENFKMC